MECTDFLENYSSSVHIYSKIAKPADQKNGRGRVTDQGPSGKGKRQDPFPEKIFDLILWVGLLYLL